MPDGKSRFYQFVSGWWVRALTIRAAFFFLLPLGCFQVRAELGLQAWAQRYGAFINADDRAYRVASDSSGNVIVAGTTDTGLTGMDIVIVKYASDGTLLWANQFNGAGNGDDKVNAVAVDSGGNVFVVGSTFGSSGTLDYLTIKYSSGGAPLWTNVFDGPAGGADVATAAAVDSGGNLYVTGYSLGVGTSYNYATIKYSGAGSQLWINFFNGTANGDDEPAAITVDSSNNVYVTGYTTGSGSGLDYAAIKYLSSGSPAWTNTFNGLGNSADSATALAVDGSNNVYVTGYSMGTSSGLDYATIKYLSTGAPSWTNRFNGQGNGDDKAVAIAVDASNNVYVAGSSTSSANGLDYATVKYSTTGVAAWTNRFNGSGNGDDVPIGLVVDRSNNVYVAGSTTTSTSGLDYATIKYSSAGVAAWTNRYNGPGNGSDQLNGVAVDVNNNIFVTGSSPGPTSGLDFATIKYLTTGAGAWTNRYNGLADGNDAAYAVAADRSNGVYVTGYISTSTNGPDCVTIKYTSFGTPLWTNFYNGPGNATDKGRAIGCDASNNVYVAGYSVGLTNGYDIFAIKYSSSGAPLWTNRFDGWAGIDDFADAMIVDRSNNIIITGVSGQDYVTIKYSSSGALLWSGYYDFGDYDEALAVTVDASNNVVVTGFSTRFGGDFDIATLKYASSGTPMWTNRWNGPGNIDDEGFAIGTDASNNVYVTGSSEDQFANARWATLKYTSAGAVVWTNYFRGSAIATNDFANALVVDKSGNIYVTGRGQTAAGDLDLVTIKYSGAGVGLWTNSFGRVAGMDDEAYAAALDSNNNIYVTGYSGGPNGDDYVTIKYSSAGVALWTNFYNGPANGNDDPGGPAIAIGPDGSAYVTGQSDGDFGPGARWDFATVKYSSGIQPGMSAISRLPNGSVQFALTAMSNQVLRIDAATNLTTPVAWTTAGFVTNFTGAVSFVDTAATNYTMRFYRAAWVP